MTTRLKIGQRSLEVGRWSGGPGLPILMLHEGLGSAAMWRDFPAALAAATRRDVIAWSREGYGHSTPVSVQFEPDYMHREAAALPELMDALGLPRAHLFGHSDGGSIALIAAAAAAEKVGSLVLEAPHVFVEELTLESIARIGEEFAGLDLARRMARYHDAPERVFWRWNNIWLDPRFHSWNIERCLGEISAPTLLIQGRDDQYGTFDQLDRIATTLPDVRRLELDECGHSPHRDRQATVLSATAQFLKGRP